MKRTKVGLSAAFISSIAFFTGYISLPTCAVLFLIALAYSDSYTAKVNATQAFVLSVFVNVISMILGMLSGSYLSIIGSLSGLFSEWFRWHSAYDVLSKFNIMGMLNSLIGIVAFVVMIIYAILSLKGKIVTVPIVSKFVDKHLSCDSDEI